MSGTVFISYSTKDRPFANRLQNDLEREGLTVWRDETSIDPGDSIISKVSKGIQSSDYLVVLISGHSMQSRWVHKELDLALTLNMERPFPIIPIRINKTPIPAKIKELLYIDAADLGYEGALTRLKVFFKKEGRLSGDTRRSAASPPTPSNASSCQDCLKALSTSQLRRKITGAFTIDQIAVVWFDLFGSTLKNDLPGAPLANVVIDLIEGAKNRRKFDELIDMICEERPNICP